MIHKYHISKSLEPWINELLVYVLFTGPKYDQMFYHSKKLNIHNSVWLWPWYITFQIIYFMDVFIFLY